MKRIPLNTWGVWTRPGEEDSRLSPESQRLLQKLAKPEVIWVPKSQAKLEGNHLLVAKWLFGEKFAPVDAEFVVQEVK